MSESPRNGADRDDRAEADRHRLFSAALDDRLSDDNAERLAQMLRTDAEARKQWFLYHDIECGLAEAGAAEPRASRTRAAGRRAPTAVVPGRSAPGAPVPYRRLAAAAACILFGMFCGSAVFAYFRPQPGKPAEILVDGFEAGLPPEATGVPDRAGVWCGDFAEIAEAQSEIAPAAGRRMLRFLRGDFEGRPLEDSFGSDIFRLVDVRPYRKEIAAGDAVVQLTAYFNAVATEGEEPAACTLTIFALEAAPVAGGLLKADRGLSRESQAYSQSSRLTMDADPASWQRGVNELRLPPNTDYLMVRIGVSNSPRGTKRRADGFAGHYADEVQVHLANRPEIALP